jgi:YfiH family protein
VQRVDRDGVVFYRFEGLGRIPGVAHALFTRRGGVSKPPFATLNLGHSVGDDLDAVRINHQRLLASVDLPPEDVVTAGLVHGARVAVVGARDRGQVCFDTDALVTADPSVVLLLRFADCVPVLFCDRRRGVVGLAHAGWRGIPAGVVPATVDCMVANLGSDPADVWAGVGPSIGPCCYEIGPAVVEQVGAVVNGRNPFRPVNDRVHLDLWDAVRIQLEEAGVGEVEVAHLCTSCHTNDWFSHRAEKGRTGRFGVVISLTGQRSNPTV